MALLFKLTMPVTNRLTDKIPSWGPSQGWLERCLQGPGGTQQYHYSFRAFRLALDLVVMISCLWHLSDVHGIVEVDPPFLAAEPNQPNRNEI